MSPTLQLFLIRPVIVFQKLIYYISMVFLKVVYLALWIKQQSRHIRLLVQSSLSHTKDKHDNTKYKTNINYTAFTRESDYISEVVRGYYCTLFSGLCLPSVWLWGGRSYWKGCSVRDDVARLYLHCQSKVWTHLLVFPFFLLLYTL